MKTVATLIALVLSAASTFAQLDKPCLPEGITFGTQAEIDNFQTNYPDCHAIIGAVEINGDDITNLNGLSVLTSIGGGLSINHNDALTSLTGLEGLSSIGSGGGLSIRHNDALTSLTGLEGLSSIGYLNISYNGSLINLTGLDWVDSIGTGFLIYGNPVLTSLTGLEGLVSIGGGLSVGYGLYQTGNRVLTSLAGLENLDTIGGDLRIVYNDSLSVCDVPFICDYLSDPSGNMEIHDNAPGCNSHLQLAYDCSITYDCLTSGTYHLYSQGDIDYFPLVYPGCTDLETDVEITGNDITNLDSLNVITSIEGNLSVHGTNCLNLSGLENLSFVSGDFKVGWRYWDIEELGNYNLVNFTGLEGLDSIGGSFYLGGNDVLINLTGLEGLSSINGNVEIRSNDSLTNLTGLDGLNSIGGNLQIGGYGFYGNMGNYVLKDLIGLENLSTIGGDFSISHNRSFNSFTGLEGLNSIDGGLSISDNDTLANFSGLEALTSIGGDLSINNNDALTNLSGLEGLDSIAGNLSISYNDSLFNCETDVICNYLSNPTGSVSIYNNANGCDNPAEIADSCGFTIPCLPYGNYYFKSQVDIDHFQVDYPGCTELNGIVSINGVNINNLNGLNEVTSIEGSLFISRNDTLSSLSGLEALTSIGGYLSIWDNDALTSISKLEGLTSIGGELRINDNDSLSSLSGLENIDAGSIERLFIRDNLTLSECAVQSVCDYLATSNGEFSIYGNADGCKTYQEVEEACKTVSISENESQNSEFALMCYPNPFSTSTTITYELQQPATIQITIYNHLGKQIEVIEKNQPQGLQKVVWNPRNLPNGVYYIRLQAGEQVASGKMVVLR